NRSRRRPASPPTGSVSQSSTPRSWPMDAWSFDGTCVSRLCRAWSIATATCRRPPRSRRRGPLAPRRTGPTATRNRNAPSQTFFAHNARVMDRSRTRRRAWVSAAVLLGLLLAAWSLGAVWRTPYLRVSAQTPSVAPPMTPIQTIPGMPPVPDPRNLYSETAAGRLSPAVAGALPRVYVPNVKANTVTVIDATTLKVVD